jgi:glycoprotein-N-acetylgalactosamine 3-beta-galactosyltransferase
MAHSKYHQGKAMQVFKMCDKLVNVSNQYCQQIPKVDQTSCTGHLEGIVEVLWTKLHAPTKYIWEHFPNFEWYLKMDDDTYVIMENLKHFLSQHKHGSNDEPLLFGKRLQNPFPVRDW